MASPVVDTPIADQSHAEQEAVSLDVSGNFSDADVTDSITYSISGTPFGSAMSIDPQTGVLSGTPNANDAAAAPYTITVTATDGSGNFRSTSLQLKLPPDVKRWNPGHYVLADGSEDTVGNDILPNSYLDEAVEMGLTGVHQMMRWVDLEPTRDNYTFSVLQDLYDRCAARNLYLVVQPLSQKFSSTSWGNYLPVYLDDDYTPTGIFAGTDSNGVLRSAVKLYRHEIMLRKVALLEAIAAQFDALPYFEGCVISETSLGISTSQDSAWDPDDFVTELVYMCEEAGAAFLRSNLWLYTNFMNNPSTARWNTIFQALEDNKVGGGGPDAVINGNINNFTDGDDHYNGNEGSGSRLGIIPYNLAVQSPELGGKEGTFTADELAQSGITLKNATHMNWCRCNWTPVTWNDDIKPYLEGSPRTTLQTRPSSYS